MSHPKSANYSWDLSPLFNSDDDLTMAEERKIIENNCYKFIDKWKKRDDYLKDPKVLKEALDEYERIEKNHGTGGNELYYYWLRTQQDENNPGLKAKFNKIQDFSKKIGNDIHFFTLRIAKIPPKQQSKMINSPDLSRYKHFLEQLFAGADYVLSEPEEKILNLKSATAYSNWVKMLSGLISKEERNVLDDQGREKVKSFSEITSLLSSPRKDVRDEAARAFNHILQKYSEVAEAEINSVLADKKVNDDLRKVPRPDLLRHLEDDIDSKIVDTLVQVTSQKFYISARYYKLKARLLGVKKLEYHERNVEIGDQDRTFSYHAAVKLVSEVFAGLDDEFAKILSDFVSKKQVDVFPKKGKRGGAFCINGLLTQPTYLMLNYSDRLSDVLTFAHELGHGINSELIKSKQNALYADPPTSTAEVASTFMEDFVLQKILQKADDKLKLSLMMTKLNEDISSIFRQIAFYEFEQELHKQFREKGYLSRQEIGKLFQKHMRLYMGEYVKQSPGSENWWIYIHHFRRYFYVYSYASGLLISKSLQSSVKDDPEYILKVKEFLSAGSSDSPQNIFSRLGIDIGNKEFWNKGLAEIETTLIDAEKLAEKLGKI